jgi:ketosteroid isomerase-like protein
MSEVAVIDAYFAAIREKDADALGALFTANADLVTVAGTFTGPTAIAGFYRDIAFQVEDLWPEPGPLIIDGERVAVEIELRMNGKVSLVGDFFTLRNGRIERLLICTGPPE